MSLFKHTSLKIQKQVRRWNQLPTCTTNKLCETTKFFKFWI